MRFLPLFLIVFLLQSAHAQIARLEGTISQTQSGVTQSAQIWWEAPDKLKIESDGQILVAAGAETRVWTSATRRLTRLPFNVGKEWWRGWGLAAGGPANFAFVGATAFDGSKTPLTMQRDNVLFGGGAKTVYYLALKRPVRDFPAKIEVKGDKRLETDDSGRVLAEHQIAWDAQKLPKKVETASPDGKFSFLYDLKTPAEAFPEATWTLPDTGGAILEETPQNASFYAGKTGAADLFLGGAALWRDAEDAPGALAAFDGAAKLAPEASAPVLESFEVALSVRNLERADFYLKKLEKLPLDKAEIEGRRARLLAARRDFAGAQAALEAAQAALPPALLPALPQNRALSLARAQLLQTRGNFEDAAPIYAEILAAPNTLPQIQADAATFLAQIVLPDAPAKWLGTAPGTTEAQKLARALVQLQSAPVVDAVEFSQPEFQESFALGLERAARDEEARAIWRKLAESAPLDLQTEARAHLVALEARRGDAGAALKMWRDWRSGLVSAADAQDAQTAFFDAFQKNFRTDALRAALQNRALATAATSDDLKLWLAFQENYGSSEEIADALALGVARFGREPFWAGRQANELFDKATAQSSLRAGPAVRERLVREALETLDVAIAAAPEQSYFPTQKALILVQNAAREAVVADPARSVANRKAAREAMTDLEKQFPGDPDVLVSLALQNLAVKEADSFPNAENLAQKALDLAPPNDGDRHVLISAARQALATVARRAGDADGVAGQWERLRQSARSASDEAAIAGGFLGALAEIGDAPSAAHAARLLETLAREPWPLVQARPLWEGAAKKVAESTFGGVVLQDLAAQTTPAARLAEFALADALQSRAATLAAAPDAAPAADALADRTARERAKALEKLAPLVTNADKLVAGRASAFLVEEAGDAQNADVLTLLQIAVESEPQDGELRGLLIVALAAKNRPDDARDALLDARRLLPDTPTNWRRLAGSTAPNERAQRFAWLNTALVAAQVSPDVSANDFQILAFSAARAAFAANQFSRGLELYNGLSSSAWATIDRAAALIDLSESQKLANRADESAKTKARIQALNLSKDDLDAALRFLESLEGS